jgi:hypothetical protein
MCIKVAGKHTIYNDSPIINKVSIKYIKLKMHYILLSLLEEFHYHLY